MRQMTFDQTDLTEFAGDGDDPDDDWPSFDEWGPTMGRPLPNCETGPILPRWLEEHGFSPEFCIPHGYGPKYGFEPPLHPDDQHRPDRIEREFERHGDVLAEQPDE